MPFRRAGQSRVSSPKVYPAHRAVEDLSAELAKQNMSALYSMPPEQGCIMLGKLTQIIPARASNLNVKREAVGPHSTPPPKLERRYSNVAQPARDAMALVLVKWFEEPNCWSFAMSFGEEDPFRQACLRLKLCARRGCILPKVWSTDWSSLPGLAYLQWAGTGRTLNEIAGEDR
ncbi:hypothetical protein PGTUg99_030940 [Puccinia graminis f. sp. tritici]|uniref:Uncharacterized protein n=1 Tax=Puccinia graminis f. sp. tritici TaxID=56615 RepID=A0A5B0PNY8_PUCGR|nr:hypothetical protein PGTUg99_030940 [Puccinia graminis f. sp. tritici]